MSITNTCIQEDGFGFVPKPDRCEQGEPFEIVRRYTLTNAHKASVQLISWGAGIQSIKVPNKKGILGDVVLGFDDLDGYLKNRYTGSVIGRIINSVSQKEMKCNNNLCSSSNNVKFNSGIVGLDNANWQSQILKNEVVMSHVSTGNNEGYPGEMLTQIKYSWTDDNQLHINIRATVTQPRLANITSHCLFNLAGHGTGAYELNKHIGIINADSWMYMDIKKNLPTGAIHPVDRSVYDLRFPTQITKYKLYNVPGGGYNHNLCVTSPSYWCYRFHARILHPASGRTLEIYSNQPTIQFCTLNDLPDPDHVFPPDFDGCPCHDDSALSNLSMTNELNEIRGKDGVLYRRHGGFILSPQNSPNSVNVHHFPSNMLYPGKVYVHDMTYKFGLFSKS